jgi:hypothetical protein
MIFLKKPFLLFFLCCALLYSCKKETFINSPDARLFITADTIRFDTVFTSTGSVTQSFKIINENNQKLRLSKVSLMGHASSAFRININGVPATEESDIDIAANDSIYIFVSVTINPTTANLPFIVTDSIRINYNGNTRYVQLEAFGQNAHFLRNEVVAGNSTWTNDLPYVILGNLRIDTSARLTIEAGTHIYMHADAPILVDGSLLVNGTKNNEVIFTGDRLDPGYRDLPASWPGIYFRNTSKDNQLIFAKIKNATQAVVVLGPSINSNPKLVMHQCIIDNSFQTGLFALNSSVDADNTLISNCGSNINIQWGGTYHFTNCTAVSYSNLFLLHSIPVLKAVNFYMENGSLVTADMNALFRNCIFWGDGGALDDEVIIEKEGSTVFNVAFENCLYKALNDPLNTTLSSVITNIDPLFDSIDINNNYFDFRITKDLSAPGIDNGTTVPQPADLDDNPRTAGTLPDMGCYEKQ